MNTTTSPLSGQPPCEIVRHLRQQLAALRELPPSPTIDSGFPALNRLLPRGGFVPGQLVEWFVEGQGHGAGMLAWQIAWRACGQQKTLVVTDRAGWFYPPAVAAAGSDFRRLLVLRATKQSEEAWGLDQALRCPAVGAVWSWQDQIPERTFRRWQLAAEQGGVLGMLLRPAHVRGQPSWADVQLLVQWPSTPPVVPPRFHANACSCGRVRVELLRAKPGG